MTQVHLGNADVVIVSAMPAKKNIRAARIKYHVRQLAALADGLPPNARILGIYSGWAKKDLPASRPNYGQVVHSDRMPKYLKHNQALAGLYQSNVALRPRACLFLDDDVVPRTPKPEDTINGIADTWDTIKDWWKNPPLAHLVFFASQGLMFDAYYRSNPVVIGPAPPQVVGWAMMVRSDLDVLWDDYLIKGFVKGRTYTADDTAFRLYAEHKGKIVQKHNRCFFKTFQPKEDTTSGYVSGQKERQKLIRDDMQVLRRLFPDQFGAKRGVTKPPPAREYEGGGFFAKS